MESAEFDWTVSLKQKLSSIWTSGENSDLIITVPLNKKGFRVHRSILSLFSPVLSQKIAELEPTQKKLHFQQIDVDSFRRYLEFTYTGTFNLPNNAPDVKSTEIFALFKVAVYFQFTGLADNCATMLRMSLDKSNVLEIYKYAMENGHKPLIQYSLKFICRNAEDVLQNKTLEDLTMDCVFEIVKEDTLCVNNELSIFNAICRWGEAECLRQQLDPKDENQLRTIIQKLLKWIRFPQMSHTDFKNNVLPRKLLNINETTSLLVYFMTPPEERGESGFIVSPRSYESPLEKRKKRLKRLLIATLTGRSNNTLLPGATQVTSFTPVPPILFYVEKPIRLTLDLGLNKAGIAIDGVFTTDSVLQLKRKIQQVTKYPICYNILHKDGSLLHDTSSKNITELGVYDDGAVLSLNRQMSVSQKQFCDGPCKNNSLMFCSLAPFMQYCQTKL